MPLKAQLVGGSCDGEIVNAEGYEICRLVHVVRRATFAELRDPPISSPMPPMEVYRRRWGWDGQLYYVYTEILKRGDY